MQADGDLTVTQSGATLWSAGTSGSAAVEVRMQENGNLVTFDSNGTPVWESGTPGNRGAYMHVQNDGNLVIYTPSGAVWAYR
jgi:hypothetical protein